MTAPVAEVDIPIPDDDLARELQSYVDRPALDIGAGDEPAPDAPAPADQPPTDPTAPEGTTPEGAVPPEPVDPAKDTDPFAELTKDAKPLTYRVNGAERTHDLILEVPGKGAVIPADKLDGFRNYVARAESNTEAVKQLLGEREQYERAGGLEKFHEQAESYAALNAVGLLLIDAIEDPLSLVTIVDGQVVPHTERISILQDRMRVAKDRAIYDTRSQRSAAEQTSRTTAQQSQQRQTAIPDTIDAHFASFTPEDREDAKSYFGQDPDLYTFTVTPENAAQYGQPVGTLMVRANLIKSYLDKRVALKGSVQTEQAKRTQAEKENATRVTTRSVVQAKPKTKGQPRAEDGTFVTKPRWTKDEMMDRALANKSNDPADEDE